MAGSVREGGGRDDVEAGWSWGESSGTGPGAGENVRFPPSTSQVWCIGKLTGYGNSYKLAEKLSERLDDVGKDLTSMIEEVNGASSTLSKTNKADEPVRSPPPPNISNTTNKMFSKIDLPNRPHPQLAPLPTASHRSRHRRSANQGRRGAKSRAGDVVAVWARIQQLGHGYGQQRHGQWQWQWCGG